MEKNLYIFDAFGSVHHLPREEEGVHQLSGYLDDSVFIIKLREWAVKTLESREWKNLWIFTYTSTGVCKLFRRPYLVYRMVWAMRELLLDNANNRGTVLTLSEPECPEISDLAYVTSDLVIETHVVNGKRVGIVTKGQTRENFSNCLEVIECSPGRFQRWTKRLEVLRSIPSF